MPVLGKSDEEKLEERDQRQYERRLSETGIKQAAVTDDQGSAAEILRILSDIDDLPVDPTEDPVMGQLVSRLTSTANLSADQVESNEWVREYLMILYLCKHPRKEGLHGSRRGWAHGDASEAIAPLSPEKRMEIETFVTTSKLALTRSEDFKAVEESVRTINESVVHDDTQTKSGGLLGKIRG